MAIALPADVLRYVFSFLQVRDRAVSSRVCKSWRKDAWALVNHLDLSPYASSINDKGLAALARICPNLQKLNLRNCQMLRGDGLLTLTKTCTSLESLCVRGTQINIGSILQVLRDSKILAKLDMSGIALPHNALSPQETIGPASVTLQSLDLSDSRLTDVHLGQLLQLVPGLRSLRLCRSRNFTPAAATEAIARSCPSLTALSLGSMPLAAPALAHLARLSELRSLTLTGTKLPGSLASLSMGLPRLEHFSLSLSNPTDQSLQEFLVSHGNRLRALQLNACPQLTDATVSVIAENCSALRLLHLLGIKKITDAPMAKVLQRAKDLQYLSVARCKKLSGAALMPLLEANGSLLELSLHSCGRVDSAALARLAEKHQELIQLDLSSCRRLEDRDFLSIVNGCKHLQKLFLRHCYRLSSDALTAFVQSVGNHLRVLDLAHCFNVNDAVLSAIGSCCPNLQTLDLSYCTRVTSQGLQAIAQGCPQLMSVKCTAVVALEKPAAQLLRPFTKVRDVWEPFDDVEGEAQFRDIPEEQQEQAAAIAGVHY
jgi:Leucine-rich repeat (LRR) protein